MNTLETNFFVQNRQVFQFDRLNIEIVDIGNKMYSLYTGSPFIHC
jgi:hypothetical protein